jgi:hypothetical protein
MSRRRSAFGPSIGRDTVSAINPGWVSSSRRYKLISETSPSRHVSRELGRLASPSRSSSTASGIAALSGK